MKRYFLKNIASQIALEFEQEPNAYSRWVKHNKQDESLVFARIVGKNTINVKVEVLEVEKEYVKLGISASCESCFFSFPLPPCVCAIIEPDGPSTTGDPLDRTKRSVLKNSVLKNITRQIVFELEQEPNAYSRWLKHSEQDEPLVFNRIVGRNIVTVEVQIFEVEEEYIQLGVEVYDERFFTFTLPMGVCAIIERDGPGTADLK